MEHEPARIAGAAPAPDPGLGQAGSSLQQPRFIAPAAELSETAVGTAPTQRSSRAAVPANMERSQSAEAGSPKLSGIASSLIDQLGGISEAPASVTPTQAGLETTTPIEATSTAAQSATEPHLGALLVHPFMLTNSDTANVPLKQGSNDGDGFTDADDTDTTPATASLWRQILPSTGTDVNAASPRTPAARTSLADEEVKTQGWTLDVPMPANPLTMTNEPNDPDTPTHDAKPVAFFQEQDAQTNDRGAESADDLQLPTDDDGAQTSGDGAEADSLTEAEQIGEEPEDTSLEFLRTETVLLKPGESQFDVGINYLLTENDFPVLLTDGMGNIVGVDEVNFRVRELTVPLEYRVGLVKRVQGFIGVPVGWSNTQLSLDTFEEFENDGGLGDIDFGLTMQLVDASVDCPHVIATIMATAPTGGDPFTNAIGLAPTAPSLGQGFWSIAGNLLFIQPYDPVVVFYGLGTEHFFSREFLGLEIEPGAQYNYTFGVGFAVNERITLSTRFVGAYVEEIKVNGERRFGTNTEPMTLRMSATISRRCDRLVEPFIEFGLTDDAISTFLGITWTY
jgi:hypothetical protein